METQFITDAEGRRIAVILPIQAYEKMREEVEHHTYPYRPDIISFSGMVYLLSRKLSCDVSYEEGMYLIRNEELDITVWGESREEAEEAFAFSFSALYKNFAQEEDTRLSPSALELKGSMNQLVKTVLHEA